MALSIFDFSETEMRDQSKHVVVGGFWFSLGFLIHTLMKDVKTLICLFLEILWRLQYIDRVATHAGKTGITGKTGKTSFIWNLAGKPGKKYFFRARRLEKLENYFQAKHFHS